VVKATCLLASYPCPPTQLLRPSSPRGGRETAVTVIGEASPHTWRPCLILIPVSVGELVDKLTILALKCQHLQGTAREHAQKERVLLQTALDHQGPAIGVHRVEALEAVNASLWHVEDQLRSHEQRQDFNADFIQLARKVYQLNDERHNIKQIINQESGSELIDQKIYGKAK